MSDLQLPPPADPADAGATYWNGERCEARCVRIVVPEWEDGDPPKAWWLNHVGETRNAVEVSYGQQRFVLDNNDGSGWLKVTVGRGSPRCASWHLPDRCEIVQ